MLANQVLTGNILVVDDSADNRFLIQTTLEYGGYEVALAENGKTALEKVEELLPDLILLDVMMPGMDGYEVTRRIRQDADHLPYIPILLITADERSSVVKGLDMGADDFIRKPVDVDELLARVRSLMRLKRSIDERDRMVRQQDDFVMRLTHDLRTPLVAADRMLGLFHQEVLGPLSDDMSEAVGSMVKSNSNLLQMVNTLLEVYRHDAGSKTLTFVPCNLREIVDEVVHELSPLATDRGLTLIAEIDKTEIEKSENLQDAATVMGDRLELRRVLTNLVGNAIKFTDKGWVKVRLVEPMAVDTATGSNPTMPSIRLEVSDSGTGIALEEQQALFKRFRQGNHKRAGSGLGLYLSRRIIESHQGNIQLQSEPGKGSVFTIHLPAIAQ
ncbi:hybrid sensor histidine kinase/response regulator [Phormidium sp. CLA17]|uniref:hybrid sensor histidine kinase/response regulator n=1 Tax=Leptolyngbya sp. Cla-17 TaxID=2803751 RepID=UPI001492C0C9|nr:hybrid sensor histidine kinase/response regulator [Leptolyngbya sp. Cla-17]MBM0743381.1 hybrid sensor histidine kinase/response regulator [Leptolyngbya sp. Cla-17]